HARFIPNSDRESEIPQKARSALPPKADMCSATGDVRFGPKADILVSFDHFVGNLLKLPRNLKAERLRSLEINRWLELGRLLDWEIARFGALQILVHVYCAAPEQVGHTRAVGHQPAGNHDLSG